MNDAIAIAYFLRLHNRAASGPKGLRADVASIGAEADKEIAELKSDLAQARSEAKVNGNEAATARTMLGDAMRRVGELQAEVERQALAADDAHLSRIAAEEERELLRSRLVSLKSCEVDAKRYRRLRLLGVALCGSDVLSRGTVVRFQTLDEAVDTDLLRYPSRGETVPTQPTSGSHHE